MNKFSTIVMGIQNHQDTSKNNSNSCSTNIIQINTMIQNIIHTDFSCKYGINFFVICIRIEKWSDIVETRQNRYFNITKCIPCQYIWERLHKNSILIKYNNNKLKHCNKVQLLQTEFFRKLVTLHGPS